MMRPIAIEDPGVLVCLSDPALHCAKTAERIEVLSGVETLRAPRHVLLDRGSDPHG